MSAEIAIRGGTVIDGTGAPPRRADVGIADGRITEIAEQVSAPEVIDASGRYVTPGFIDIHTHYDPQVLWDPALTPSSWHGVTSVVAGNCGYSIAPTRSADRGSLMRTLDKVEDMRISTLEAGVDWSFETYPEYLAAVVRRGVAINFGGYVGHTPVRLYVMGDEAYERHATDDEVARMREVVADSIRGGAIGFSSDRAGFHVGDGGRPVPSIAASQEETEALAAVTGELGRGVVHMAPGENYRWVYEFQKQLGRPLNWSSILTYPASASSRGFWGDKLATHEAGRASGADVWVQVTCRPITQQVVMIEPTPFYQLDAFKELVPVPFEERHRYYEDPQWRARAFEQLDGTGLLTSRWGSLLVAESPDHPELEGRSIADLAAERGVAPWDALCDTALADGLWTRFQITFANDDEEGISTLIRGDGTIMGLSDAGAHVSQICDAVMPTDFLANWVRDRALLPVEAGIHKLTGEIADVIRSDRGRLAPGAPADVVVLDLDAVSTGPIHRVADMPAGGERLVADHPGGIDHVLVNGVPIRTDGKPVVDELDELPGQLLRAGV